MPLLAASSADVASHPYFVTSMRAYFLLTFASALPIVGFLAQLPLPEVGNLTATAMLGWYAWHTVARTIPDLVASFRTELAAERASHRADIEALCRELAALTLRTPQP
ncbi:MAG: hypothetical protein WD894_05415 [Pirellulales bacterium]